MKYALQIIFFLFLFSCAPEANTEEEEFVWLPYTDEVFEKAKKEDKLVLLDIGANWCHWCHVMDEKTYADEEVQRFLSANFVLAREDQDSRPDLFAAYRNWGWPAIIVLNDEQEDLLRLKGYQEKSKFTNALKNILDNPVPLEKNEVVPSALKASDQQLFQRYLSNIDHEKGMYKKNHKSLHLEGIEHGLFYYFQNDSLKSWTDISIQNSYDILDPVWGGMYQYSTGYEWTNQHFEKLLRIQANCVEAYARYGMVANDSVAIEKAEHVLYYCERFLGNDSPLFYNSQNADVISGKPAESYYAKPEDKRLLDGIPSVDENTYLKENAMMAKSLIYLWAATGKEQYLHQATEMTSYIRDNFSQYQGIYSRNKGKVDNIYSFEGNRELLELFMLLFQATGDLTYLGLSESLGSDMIHAFLTDKGMNSSLKNSLVNAVVELNNIDAIINYNYLSHLTTKEELKSDFSDLARRLFSGMDQQGFVKRTVNLPIMLKLKRQLNVEPYHAVYISDGNDEPNALEFFKVILAHTDQYIIFERAVKGQFNEEQTLLYGSVDPGTLFLCTSSFCSAPMTHPDDLKAFLKSL